MKVDIDMGSQPGGKAATLDLEELLATRLLVQGNSGSGKSHLLRRLLEQSAPWVQQCVIDPEGDFVTLADKYGHVVVDAERSEAELTRIAGRIRLTLGTEALSFRLSGAEGEPSEPSAGHRVRGKTGDYRITEWGQHPAGTELVLRFEGRKIWMKVA